MRCARCHRQINSATVSVGGFAFGPKCAVAMNLVQPVQRTTKTQHRAAKRGRISGNYPVVVIDGQVEMFE